VNYTDGEKFKRGQGFFRFSDIQEDLCWYVGYRKMKYEKYAITKALRRLRERNMIATTKTTRGIIVTVCKYDYYQEKKNYEGNNEGKVKAKRKKSSDTTISKEDNNKEGIYRQFDKLVLTENEFKKLLTEGYTKKEIDDILDAIENFKDNKKYKNLMMTARNWIKRDRARPVQRSKYDFPDDEGPNKDLGYGHG